MNIVVDNGFLKNGIDGFAIWNTKTEQWFRGGDRYIMVFVRETDAHFYVNTQLDRNFVVKSVMMGE